MCACVCMLYLKDFVKNSATSALEREGGTVTAMVQKKRCAHTRHTKRPQGEFFPRRRKTARLEREEERGEGRGRS